MWKMVVISALLGAGGSMVGAAASAIFANLPSGAMIVLVCAGFFGISMVFGPERGILLRVLRRVELSRTVDRQHLLRAIFEILDATGQGTAGQNTAGMRAADRVNEAIPIQSLLSKRSWSPWRLNMAIARARHADLVTTSEEDVRLTPAGLDEAARLTRQHRLWELYLINYAEIAPSRVDQDADAIEHVLEPQVISRLESLLESSAAEIPDSPHDLTETETSTLAAPQ
jgi:manganese/zinc/iron transport system permease protein